jgi:glycosyltransferase involved in cell wall biosynthesis
VRIALDATYSIDPLPSGIAIYSREMLEGLPRFAPDDFFVACYRPKQFRQSSFAIRSRIARRLLLPPLLTFRVDLFHALNQRVDRRPAKRVVATFHDLFVMTGEYSSAEFRARFSQQAKLAAMNSDLIIAVSEFTASQVNGLLKVERSRIRVIPHGVHLPKQTIEVPRKKSILLVGTLQARKNVTRLVEAFESVPRDWTLILAGATTGYRSEEVLARIARSSCRDRIQLTGYVTPSQLQALYSSASIFAFPSLDEGFGIPVLEAMAHKLPVVTSRTSALEEIACGAALLVDPTDTQDLATALNRLIDDEDLRTRLARLGFERANNYSWEKAVKETYAVYQELGGN